MRKSLERIFGGGEHKVLIRKRLQRIKKSEKEQKLLI